MAERPRAPDEPGSDAVDQQFAGLYQELRRLARHLFAGERREHTLQATALVNEAYLQLRACSGDALEDPLQFKVAAAVAMRRILVAHARSKGRLKRGGNWSPRSLDSVELASAGAFDEVLAIDEALERLQAESPELTEVVRLRFYAGLEVAEVAKVQGRSERSVARDWRYAKIRLFQLLRTDQ